MLTRDLRFYGLLKTIGTTTAQMKKIVLYQVNLIYVMSIPLGVLLGYIIGWRILSPIFMSLQDINHSYSFNLAISIFTIIFTYITAITSAIIPVKKIIPLYCIDALLGDARVVGKNRIKKSHHGAKPWLMALSNLARKPKKKYCYDSIYNPINHIVHAYL